MSIFVIRNSHELHQLKKALPLLRASMSYCIGIIVPCDSA